MSYFGEYLRAARGSLSLSQAAAKIGCTKAHLWDLETARSDNPTMKLLDAIGRAYVIDVEYLAMAWATRTLPAERPAESRASDACRTPADESPGRTPNLLNSLPEQGD